MSLELIALHTGLITDIAKIVDEYQKLCIYHISRERYDPNSYIDFIVVGDSEDFVKYVHPNGSIINPNKTLLNILRNQESQIIIPKLMHLMKKFIENIRKLGFGSYIIVGLIHYGNYQITLNPIK